MPIRDRLFLPQIRHIRADPSDPRTRAVRGQIKRDLGVLLAPFALHLASPPALTAYWAMFREPTCGPRVDRAIKEAVASTVSALNTCPYCVDVHTTVLKALGDKQTANAIAAGHTGSVTDKRMRSVIEWARATRQPGSPALLNRPFNDEQAPEIVGTALGYHYINRMVNIFAVETPFNVGPHLIKAFSQRLAVPLFRLFASRKLSPGGSLELLDAAPTTDGFAWATSDPVIAEAFARAGATFDDEGERAVPVETRRMLEARLRAWDGKDPGISRAWTNEHIEQLPAQQQDLARFVLLAALAPYQVDADVVRKARHGLDPNDDETIVASAAWASFAAVRRISTWL